MRTALCLIVIVFCSSGGEVSISHAMKQVGEVKSFAIGSLLTFLQRALRQPWFWFGVGLLAVNFFSMLILLSWENVSFVIPASALSYVIGALAARLLLGEHLTSVRWAGIVLVSVGVALASFGG